MKLFGLSFLLIILKWSAGKGIQYETCLLRENNLDLLGTSLK